MSVVLDVVAWSCQGVIFWLCSGPARCRGACDVNAVDAPYCGLISNTAEPANTGKGSAVHGTSLKLHYDAIVMVIHH